MRVLRDIVTVHAQMLAHLAEFQVGFFWLQVPGDARRFDATGNISGDVEPAVLAPFVLWCIHVFSMLGLRSPPTRSAQSSAGLKSMQGDNVEHGNRTRMDGHENTVYQYTAGGKDRRDTVPAGPSTLSMPRRRPAQVPAPRPPLCSTFPALSGNWFACALLELNSSLAPNRTFFQRKLFLA